MYFFQNPEKYAARPTVHFVPKSYKTRTPSSARFFKILAIHAGVNFFKTFLIFPDPSCSNKHIGPTNRARNKVTRPVEFFLIWGSGLLRFTLWGLSTGSRTQSGQRVLGCGKIAPLPMAFYVFERPSLRTSSHRRMPRTGPST